MSTVPCLYPKVCQLSNATSVRVIPGVYKCREVAQRNVKLMVLTVVEFQPLDLPYMDTVFSHLVFDISQPHWFLSAENVNTIIIIVCA